MNLHRGLLYVLQAYVPPGNHYVLHNDNEIVLEY